MEEAIGQITHYFPKVGVAIVALTKALKIGDNIKIKGKKTEFEQAVDSMQFEHQSLTQAEPGREIGLKVNTEANEGDVVYKIV